MADDTKSGNRPWDDQVDQFVASIDRITKGEADISLRDLLLNPDKYLSGKDFGKTLATVKEIVGTYFGSLMDSMKDEKEKLRSELESMGAQYTRINEVISGKASGAKIPYVKPFIVDMDTDLKEEIVIEQYNETVDALIGKLVLSSTYVADLSGTYKGHTLGSWLFSAERPYVLTIKTPSSLFIVIENASDTITAMLESLVPVEA